MAKENQRQEDPSCRDGCQEGRDQHFMDIDRMVNEGLGGGTVSFHNGLIGDSTTDTMDHPESVLNSDSRNE